MDQDDILIDEFNRTVSMHNRDMETDSSRASEMTKLTPEYFNLFNFKGYPRINPDTYELEWWVNTADFTEVLNSLGVTDDTNDE